MIARVPRYGRSATLSELLARPVARAGSRVAIHDGDQRLTWTLFARRVEGLARYLADRGVAPGVPVALWLPNGIDYLRSEEHTSELQSLMRISYAVFCLKKKKQ